MAAEEGLEERTEDASQQRRDEWRKQGNVAQSREVSSAALVMVVATVIYSLGGWTLRGVKSVFETVLSEMSRLAHTDWTPSTIMSMASYIFRAAGVMIAPVVGSGSCPA